MDKEVILPSGKYLMVEVPGDVTEFNIGHNYDNTPMNPTVSWEIVEDDWDYKDIPSGNWSIIGKGDEIYEPQWKKIIENNEEYKNIWIYKDYINGKALHTATESGHSWIISQGFEPSKTLILKAKDNG